MAIATQGDVVTYSDTGTTKLTSQGVTLMSPGGAAAVGTSTNPMVTAEAKATAGAKTSVTSAASSTSLIAANTNRKMLIITNESTAVLYIDLSGGTASATSYSVVLGPTATSVSPSFTIGNFTGAVTGIWASANGFARITELT